MAGMEALEALPFPEGVCVCVNLGKDAGGGEGLFVLKKKAEVSSASSLPI